MMTITITNDSYDIYEILRDRYGCKGRIHQMEVTNRLLLTGRAGEDLRCILFSYSWDHNREFSSLDLMQFDGCAETNVDYIVRTVGETEIIAAVRDHAEKYLLRDKRQIREIILSGDGERICAEICADYDGDT